ncbi:MAG: aminotransferase class I/II-fold pyridoxal phosphate-dependent enzyme [Pseudomonadota bacterium]
MFHPFQVEQFLSETEQTAQFNFSESGVHPLTLGELMELADLDVARLKGTALDYPEVNGMITLREKIAALYPGAGPDNVLVTVGASEANHLVAATLLEPGDRAIALRPTYQQLPGNALNSGFQVDTISLVESDGWALDREALAAESATPAKLLHLVNPNNPTGRILSAEERAAVVAAADRCGAWIVADEVYAGTEREANEPTPSFWGAHERVIAINSMSKAYGLPGLRLGWVVAPGELIIAFWRRHEYATITATMLGNLLADAALDPAVRPKLTARARRLIRRGFDKLTEGLAVHPGVFSVVPPQASAMSFVKYDLPIDSRSFAQRLLRDHGTLVVPGACFGLEHHFRFSSALPDDVLSAGLERLNVLVSEIRAEAQP